MDNNEVVLCDFDDKVAYIIGYVTYKWGCRYYWKNDWVE